jgi:hypothetical protein
VPAPADNDQSHGALRSDRRPGSCGVERLRCPTFCSQPLSHDHPDAGELELDCDVLSVHGADLHISGAGAIAPGFSQV